MGAAGNESTADISLIGVSVTAAGAEALKELTNRHGKIAIRQPNASPFDPAEIVLLALAVGTIFVGSAWMPHHELPPRRLRDPEGNLFLESHDEVDAVISLRAAASFALVASVVLLFLYFTMSTWLLAILTGLFALIAWQATAYVLVSAFRAVGLRFKRETRLCQARFTETDTAAAVLSAVIVGTWLCFRGAHWSWILQNALSISLLVVMIHSVVLPNLRVATILLCGALIYDVWWVFLQPAVLGGRSIMVEVATGGDNNVGFQMPMVLTVPQFFGLGTNPAMAVLGLGDVVLPGFLVAMGRRWDLHKASLGTASAAVLSIQYFLALLIAYGGGLMVTFVALARGWGGNDGQPALLYLCPATLGMTTTLAWANGDLRALWEWEDPPHESVEERDIEEAPVENAPLLNSTGRDHNEAII
jgi:signal peptide peptidase-like protein 2B